MNSYYLMDAHMEMGCVTIERELQREGWMWQVERAQLNRQGLLTRQLISPGGGPIRPLRKAQGPHFVSCEVGDGIHASILAWTMRACITNHHIFVR